MTFIRETTASSSVAVNDFVRFRFCGAEERAGTVYGPMLSSCCSTWASRAPFVAALDAATNDDASATTEIRIAMPPRISLRIGGHHSIDAPRKGDFRALRTLRL